MDSETDATPDYFAELLRGLRRQAGFTQEDLAERAGLGTRTAQDLERGQHRPRVETLQQLTRALALSGKWLAQFETAARRGIKTRYPPR